MKTKRNKARRRIEIKEEDEKMKRRMRQGNG